MIGELLSVFVIIFCLARLYQAMLSVTTMTFW